MLDNVQGTAATATVSVVRPEDSEVLDVFGGAMIVRSAGGADRPFVAEHAIPPGYMVPPHLHEGDDEYFFVLDGPLTIWSEGGEQELAPGAFVSLPRGVRHGFRNASETTVRFLIVAWPGIQSTELFRHFDRAGRAAPGGLTPPEIVAICAQYGVRM